VEPGDDEDHQGMTPLRLPRRLPRRRGIVLDRRGQGRALRVTWHHEASVAVVSVWREDRCAGTVHVAAEDVPALIAMLAEGLSEGYGAGPGRIGEAS
jgi:hypothetical protein